MDNDENKIPKFISQRIDLKGITTSVFANLVTALKSEKITDQDTKFFIITNFGTIQCNIAKINDNTEEASDHNWKALISVSKNAIWARDDLLIEYENDIGTENIHLVNNCEMLTLKDVTIIPYANPKSPFNLPIMFLFTDQIVGVTFGTMSL